MATQRLNHPKGFDFMNPVNLWPGFVILPLIPTDCHQPETSLVAAEFGTC